MSLILTGTLLAGCNSSSSATITLKGAGATSSTSMTFLAAIDPTELNIKVYKFAVSASTDCTNLITIYENSAPTAVNLLSNPTIGSGSLAEGTYPCIAMEMSDNITFVPASNEGSFCTAGTTYTLDVCRTDNNGTSKLVDGSTTTCTGSYSGGTSVLGEDKVTIYMSTTGANGNEGFIPTSPFPLTSAFTVTAAATATFIVDGTGKVESGPSECDMQPPTFGFSSASQ